MLNEKKFRKRPLNEKTAALRKEKLNESYRKRERINGVEWNGWGWGGILSEREFCFPTKWKAKIDQVFPAVLFVCFFLQLC